MSRPTGPYPRVPALRNECGTQREVAWRTISSKAGRYACATCRRQTSRAIVARADWGDYWERQNQKSPPRTSYTSSSRSSSSATSASGSRRRYREAERRPAGTTRHATVSPSTSA